MRELLLKIIELSSSHMDELRITVFNDYVVIELYRIKSKKQLKISHNFLKGADPILCQQALELELTKLYTK